MASSASHREASGRQVSRVFWTNFPGVGEILESWDSGILGFWVSPRISGSQDFSFPRRPHASDAGTQGPDADRGVGILEVSVRHHPALTLVSAEAEVDPRAPYGMRQN